MNQNKLCLVGVCLSDYEDVVQNNLGGCLPVALIQEALIEQGYHVNHIQHVHGDPVQLAPVRAYIRGAIADQSNGIPTNVNVSIKPANQHCYSVLFFK